MIRTLENPLPVETLREAIRHFTVTESVKGYLKTLELDEQTG